MPENNSNPFRVLAAIVSLAALLCAQIDAASPQICRIHGGNTKIIWGTGFNTAKVSVFTWKAAFDKQKAIRLPHSADLAAGHGAR